MSISQVVFGLGVCAGAAGKRAYDSASAGAGRVKEAVKAGCAAALDGLQHMAEGVNEGIRQATLFAVGAGAWGYFRGGGDGYEAWGAEVAANQAQNVVYLRGVQLALNGNEPNVANLARQIGAVIGAAGVAQALQLVVENL